MTTCKGCGVKLQSDDSLKVGYQINEKHAYCQRCYRLVHYGEITHTLSMDFNYQTIANQINLSASLLVWIVDLLDIESSLISGINRIFNYQKIIIIATKRDLLPKKVNDKKLIAFIKGRLNAFDIEIKDILLVGKTTKTDLILNYIKSHLTSQQVTFIGQANAGKSTLINRLTHNNSLTVSYYPGTTLDMITLNYPEFTIYDSPGFGNPHNYLWYLKKEDLKYVIFKNPLKEKIYQIYSAQSFAIENLVRFDISPQDKCSVVFYFSEFLNIHRGKLINADKYWDNINSNLLKTNNLIIKKKHLNLLPAPFDIVIKGLGWIKIINPIDSLSVYVHQDVDVIIRKVMI